MRLVIVPLLLVLLPGCATDRLRGCSQLAGAGWTLLGQPPVEAKLMLAQENLPNDSQLVWLHKGKEQVIACYYARGMSNPSCGGSVAYKFVQKDGAWAAQGQSMDFCDPDAD
jgi:hypothetical protein